LRNWLKTTLFVSAFSPTLLVLAGVSYYSNGIDTLFYQLVAIALIGLALPFLILFWVNNHTESLNFTAKKVESADYFLLVFIASYTAPIIMKMAEVDFVLMLLTIGVIFIISWVVSNIPSHPVLYLAKFRFYKIESDSGMVYTLITRRQIRDPKSITSVKQISNSMLME
jgi:hypothetical protein